MGDPSARLPRQSMRPVVARAIKELGDEIDELVVVSADGRALALEFERAYPSRFFEVGIAEANLMGVAAGLARSGRRVVVCGMAPFLIRRAAEQLRIDICVPGLDVAVLGVGGGVGYGTLGPTHQVPEDLGSVASMAGARAYCPADVHDGRWSVRQAVMEGGPAYVRLGARDDEVVHSPHIDFASEQPRLIGEPRDVLVVAMGGTVSPALIAAEQARAQGVATGVLCVTQVAPFPAQAVREAVGSAHTVLTVEEHFASTGLAAWVALALCGQSHVRFVPLAVDARRPPARERADLFSFYGIDSAAILRAALAKDPLERML